MRGKVEKSIWNIWTKMKWEAKFWNPNWPLSMGLIVQCWFSSSRGEDMFCIQDFWEVTEAIFGDATARVELDRQSADVVDHDTLLVRWHIIFWGEPTLPYFYGKVEVFMACFASFSNPWTICQQRKIQWGLELPKGLQDEQRHKMHPFWQRPVIIHCQDIYVYCPFKWHLLLFN